jgi:hypothetical protein
MKYSSSLEDAGLLPDRREGDNLIVKRGVNFELKITGIAGGKSRPGLAVRQK